MDDEYFETYIIPYNLQEKGFLWYFWTPLSMDNFMKTIFIDAMFGYANGVECTYPERKWISIVNESYIWFIFKDERDAVQFKLAFGGPDMHLKIIEK